ncbi:hypothetical protein V8F06_013634 [Rhypophila decipiens]
MAGFISLLLASTLLGVTANPAPYGYMENYIAKRDTVFPASISPGCTDFVNGADGAASGTSSWSQVCISVNPANHSLTVVYPTSPQGYSYTKEHVWCTSTITFTPSTFLYTLESTTTITSIDTTSYNTTSTSVYVTTTTSTSIYDTTEYSTSIFPSTSTTTSTSISTPATQYETSTCHKA